MKLATRTIGNSRNGAQDDPRNRCWRQLMEMRARLETRSEKQTQVAAAHRAFTRVALLGGGILKHGE